MMRRLRQHLLSYLFRVMNFRIKPLSIFFLTALFSSCFQLFDSGPNTLIKKVFNSSKGKQAILFLKGGNATSNNSLQVSIKNSVDDLDKTEVGNTFTADANHGNTSLDSNAVTFTWLTDTKLQVNYKTSLRTFIQLTNVNGVDILYKKQ
jgi:hypothetical protein